MANYQLLKADIDAKVYQNGQQEITGANLNSVLNAMVTTLGAEYQFAGVATTATNPGTPDAKVFYIANGKGTYTNFGGIEVTENEVVVLYWDTVWHKEATGIAIAAQLNQLGQYVDNPEWIQVITDSEGKVLGGRKQDGTLVENVGFEAEFIQSNISTSNIVNVNKELRLSSEAKRKLENTLYDITNIIDVNDAEKTQIVLSNIKRPARDGSHIEYTPFTLLHASDIHGNKIALERIVEYKEKYSQYLDGAIISGDIVTRKYTDGIDFYKTTPGASDIMLAVGNHDTNGDSSVTEHVGTDCYNLLIKDFASNWEINSVVNKCYYYKDYPSYNIRLIVTDGMEANSASQVAWLEQVLNDAKNNSLAVIAVNHFAVLGNYTPFECSFNSRQYKNDGWAISAEFITLVESFIENGGEFICWLTGHAHKDFVGVINNSRQVIITVDTASYEPNASEWSDTNRTVGTRTQDLFNIIAVDSYNKTIKVWRVGANMDAWLRSKNTMSIQYASNSHYTLDNNVPVLIHCE